MATSLSPDELRRILDEVDRRSRLPWLTIVLGAALTALAVGIGFKVFDGGDATHVLIVCAAVAVYAQAFFTTGLIQARQQAANARILRALELLDEQVGRR